MIQDVFSKLQVIISPDLTKANPGFYHTKHFVVLTGKMNNNFKFIVTRIEQPVVKDAYKNALGSNNTDFDGFKSKYLNHLSEINTLGILLFSNFL